MTKYILRLDDASDKMDAEKWTRMEKLCDQYEIKPLVAIIPENKDPDFSHYETDVNFWKKVHSWEKKKWTIALHGLNHTFSTNNAGINPINLYSEFAGLDYSEQRKKILSGLVIFENHGLDPKVFVAPAHSFDENTIKAIKDNSNIRFISDVPATDCFFL